MDLLKHPEILLYMACIQGAIGMLFVGIGLGLLLRLIWEAFK